MRYRIRYNLWAVEAKTKEEALSMVVNLYKTMPQSLLTVEEDTSKNPLWKRIVTGR